MEKKLPSDRICDGSQIVSNLRCGKMALCIAYEKVMLGEALHDVFQILQGLLLVGSPD